MITNINSEDRLVQNTFADHLKTQLGWDSVYAFHYETFGPNGTLGRNTEQEVVLTRDLRNALTRLNPQMPPAAIDDAVRKLTALDNTRSLVQQNQAMYRLIRDGVPVAWRDTTTGKTHQERARVLDFRNPANNRFLAVRELKIQGVTTPHYNRRADLVCFVNGLPLVFIELKAVYKNIRAAFDHNLTDYLTDAVIPHAFLHNAFIIASNGAEAKYGSITAKWEYWNEWKRTEEDDPANVDAEALLNGMLEPSRLLDLVENFILFDESRVGGARKIVARNHQVMGVNRAVASVVKQEDLKRRYPVWQRIVSVPLQMEVREVSEVREASGKHAYLRALLPRTVELPLLKSADRDLGRLGVFWHTQGSGKSYSMAFFVEKVRRAVGGNFTFVVMTDREDLDKQAHETFVGVGVADERTPRASSGVELKKLLGENHRFIFTLIHKFNQTVTEAYSTRDDIIVLSDEAHRSQGGKYARNMRLALPNASFIGFTGTPLFKQDELTRRIFGDYVSRYDFQRSVEDGATVRLVYENRGEQLKLATTDLNTKLAAAIEEYEGDPTQQASLKRKLGKAYEVVTAAPRLDKIAADFVEHCSLRWETGKAMLVCIDKITCAQMWKRIIPLWKKKQEALRTDLVDMRSLRDTTADDDMRERYAAHIERTEKRLAWMESTLIEVIISEAQNEVKDFAEIGFDIIPHREIMKRGFQTPDGKRLAVDDAFKNPDHPFRVAIICAMWLTGFDVECLSTLYIDKPMRAHNLMQAIARANRVYPGKECGVIVDYNGMLKSLRQALAQYAAGEDSDPNDPKNDITPPIEDLLQSLVQALENAEDHLRTNGFDPARLASAKGFAKTAALKDAADALSRSDEIRRRFEIMARAVFSRFKALVAEPSAYQFAVRHDNIEAIFRKIQERIVLANIDDIMGELRRIVGDAIIAEGEGADYAEGISVDLSKINFDALQEEFVTKLKRPHLALKDIRDLIEQKLAVMLARNPGRINFQEKYQAIIDEYNREKDRATIEATVARLAQLVAGLSVEETRAAREGLSEEELAIFDLLEKANPTKAERERVKQASQSLLTSLEPILAEMPLWYKNPKNQAGVEMEILEQLWTTLPKPPFTKEDTKQAAQEVYNHLWASAALTR